MIVEISFIVKDDIPSGASRIVASRIGAVAVENRLPCGAGVGGLPRTAGGCGQVPRAGNFRVHSNVNDAAGHEGRADTSQPQWSCQSGMDFGRLVLRRVAVLRDSNAPNGTQRQSETENFRHERPGHIDDPIHKQKYRALDITVCGWQFGKYLHAAAIFPAGSAQRDGWRATPRKSPL